MRTYPLLFLSLVILGCDSSLPYNVNLGSSSTLPQVDATMGPPAATGQPVTFSAVPGGNIPVDWVTAQSLKVDIDGNFLPMASSSVGYQTVIPSNLPFTKPLDGSALNLAYQINDDHVLVARTTFH